MIDSSQRAAAPGARKGTVEPLLEAHQADVARLCRHILGPGPAAADAAQEALLRGRRGFGGYDPRQPFRRWLLAIASHHCIDVLRRQRRESRIFEPGPMDAEALRDPGPSPLRIALGSEERARLREAIEALPPRYRLPLVLRYFNDLDHGEIAEALGVSRAQVGTLLFRARRRLREQLEMEIRG